MRLSNFSSLEALKHFRIQNRQMNNRLSLTSPRLNTSHRSTQITSPGCHIILRMIRRHLTGTCLLNPLWLCNKESKIYLDSFKAMLQSQKNTQRTETKPPSEGTKVQLPTTTLVGWVISRAHNNIFCVSNGTTAFIPKCPTKEKAVAPCLAIYERWCSCLACKTPKCTTRG